MTNLFVLGLTNAIVATVLAIVVWCVTRVWRQPPLVQLLWVLVLVKLVTPPLVAIPLRIESQPAHASEPTTTLVPTELPEIEPSTAIATVNKAPHAETSASAPIAVPGPVLEPIRATSVNKPAPIERGRYTDASREPLNWISLPLTVWITGSAIWLLIAVARLARFHRALGATVPCSDDVCRWADEAAAKLGVSNRFRLRMTDARLSPLVWPIGRPTILLSRPLLEALSPEEIQTLLTHELAHLRRRDHWLRWLELFVTTAYWWHPVLWWARRSIQQAEEQACDAWVVWAFPNAAKRYASALFKAVQMASEHRPSAPMVASRLGSAGNLKGRIEDIMNSTWKCRLNIPARIAMLLAALSILPFSLRAVAAADEPAADAKSKKTTVVDEQKRKATLTTQRDGTEPTTKKSAARMQSSTAKDDKIHAGMHIVIQVANTPPEAPINGEFAVEPAGTVPLGPMYGRIGLVDMTIAEAEAAITRKLSQIINRPSVQVTMVEAQPVQPRYGDANHPYRISPGDVIHVTLANGFSDQPLNDDFIVEPSGSVALGPAYGRAKVAGLTLEEAECAVVKQLVNIIDAPEAQVTIGGWRNKATTPAGRHAVASSDRMVAMVDGHPVENTALRERQAPTTSTAQHAIDDNGALIRALALKLPEVNLEMTPSVSAWKIIVASKKSHFERMKALSASHAVTAEELEQAKKDYDLSIAQRDHALRNLKYAQLGVDYAETEYQEAVAKHTADPKSISEYELRKLRLKVDMARLKVSECE